MALAKKKGKKSKEMQRLMRQMGMGNGGAGANGGGLSSLLPSRRSNQFLVGLLLGAAATYVLSDEQMRGRLMQSGIKLYTSLTGGLEEMKEQMADIQAELAAEQNGAI